MVNFDDVKILKILGAGMFGTTYLVLYNNNKYAMKIQHILPSHKNKSFTKSLWRELDLYKYINKLPPYEQIFFTKLYNFEIYDKCDHTQKRPMKHNKNDKFGKILTKLDNSTWCVRQLTEYKGHTTLEKYLQKNTMTIKQTYSIILQICNIMFILYKGGYSHNDLHPGNIMINATKLQHFKIMNKRIPFCGLHLTAIDYGEVLHKKFKLKSKQSQRFVKNRKKWLYHELYGNIMWVIQNIVKYFNFCIKHKKKLPWQHKKNMYDIGTKLMIKKHSNFFNNAKNKYLEIFPKASKLINYVQNNIDNIDAIGKKIKNKQHSSDFREVLNRIIYEFSLFYPKKYAKYFGWYSTHRWLLPTQDVLDLLLINNANDFARYCIGKIQKLDG